MQSVYSIVPVNWAKCVMCSEKYALIKKDYKLAHYRFATTSLSGKDN